MSGHINPYIAGNPIGDDGFFGREDVLRDVLQVLHNPKENAIVLYGQRRIGKTSVLLQLERQLRETGDFDAVYFDLQDKAGLSLEKVLYELAQRIVFNLNLPALEPGQFSYKVDDYFQNSFLPLVIEHNDKDLVLLFDEFDVLDSPGEAQAGQSFSPTCAV